MSIKLEKANKAYNSIVDDTKRSVVDSVLFNEMIHDVCEEVEKAMKKRY